MYDNREVKIFSHFFPEFDTNRKNRGFVSIWRLKRDEIISNSSYSFPTRASLNRLANVLRINTTVTRKPDNIEVMGAYYNNDSHVTEIIIKGKLQ